MPDKRKKVTKTEIFVEREKEERKLKRELLKKEMQEWMKGLREDELDKPYLVIGSRSFTPRQLMKEVEDDTEVGRLVERTFDRGRMEMAKRRR